MDTVQRIRKARKIVRKRDGWIHNGSVIRVEIDERKNETDNEIGKKTDRDIR